MLKNLSLYQRDNTILFFDKLNRQICANLFTIEKRIYIACGTVPLNLAQIYFFMKT
jgi:hypothetical protein